MVSEKEGLTTDGYQEEESDEEVKHRIFLAIPCYVLFCGRPLWGEFVYLVHGLCVWAPGA